MVKSISKLLDQVTGPLGEVCGPVTKVLTVEAHGDEVRGLVLCPGKVMRYVLNSQSKRLETAVLMKIAKSPRVR